MKKMTIAALVASMAIALGACGSVHYSSSTTTTTTVTDTEGNTVTTTTSTTESYGDPVITTCEEAAGDGEQHTADLNIINGTDSEITELYIATEEDDTWGDNCLETPLEAGEDVSDRGFTMTYSEDSLAWEIKLVDGEGEEHTFEWDLTDCDAENLTIEFGIMDDGGWGISYY